MFRLPFFKKAPSETPGPERSPYKILNRAFRQVGIGNYETAVVSGESYFMQSILPGLLQNTGQIIFDVGANVGNYSATLMNLFPEAKIFAFEPAAQNFSRLSTAVDARMVTCLKMALGSEVGQLDLFDYESDSGSEHASFYSDVLKRIHKSVSVKSDRVSVETIQSFCESRKIGRVDFLKLDVEGHELAVLKGAGSWISDGKLPVIQFEFNEMNVISRSFLKDFYDILPDHTFFRLMSQGLLPLGDYSPYNEIFHFQNLLAVDFRTIPYEKVSPFLAGV